MRAALALTLVLFAGCANPPATGEPRPPQPGPGEPAGKGPPEKPNAGLPDDFKVVGAPETNAAFLAPADAWRELRSRLTTLKADALAGGEDILVTFEKNALHATSRRGRRRTWRLPDGLDLAGGPAYLRLGADGSLRLYRRDHSQVPLGAEVTIVTASLRQAGGNVEKIRLVIQGGRAIRSISTAG